MTKIRIWLFRAIMLSMLLIVGKSGQAQQIVMKTENTALVLNVDDNKNLNVFYHGAKLQDDKQYEKIPAQYNQGDDYTEVMASAYTSSGSKNLLEPAITVIHSDGNTSLDLQYISHERERISEGVELYTIRMEDPVYSFYVDLNYKLYRDTDVFEQWTRIHHDESGPVTLEKFASANLYLKSDDFYLTQYHGDWAEEMQPEVSRLTHGIKVLDTKLGTRANLYQPSVFMISMDSPAQESSGEVLYGALEWSGNFKIDLELDPLDNLRVIAGMNDYASAYTLEPGEDFITPKFLHLLSDKGKGLASRNLHRWARDHKILNGNGSRLTLLNNWEATYFDFDEQKLFNLLEDTKELGVDLFLLDDGWFGNKYPRNNDDAGLGDWQANKKKLPNGVSSLVAEADEQDVKFGIWIEPEMVNPESNLYHDHPDWVIKQPEREEHYFRNQLVLDLSNPEVQDFVFNVVDDLLTENPEMAYIKWDANAVIYNAYSSYLDNQTHLYIEYVKGLYDVLERIREKYPEIPMMLCSGGGGRVDYAALKYFTEFWPSDNTDALERVFMQWEYSNFYPAISVANHVTEWGDHGLKYRTDVAMMGKLGFDIVIDDLPSNDLQFVKGAVSVYDGFKEILWHGDLYRLWDPKEKDVASLMYVNEDQTEAIMFNYLVNNRYNKGSKTPIRLKGLDPDKNYTLTELNLYPGTQSPIEKSQEYTGEFLMKVGFNPKVDAQRKSVILNIEAQ